MDQLTDFFARLFDVADWPPRWHCGHWTSFHGWLYIAADLAIWLAYFTIPMLLAWFLRHRPTVPFSGVFWLFVLFIFACGATHLIDAIIFWWPAYRVSALIRVLTAIASWGTIVALVRILPQALLLRSPAELEAIVEQRTQELQETAERLRLVNEDLEVRVRFRNLELERTVEKLRAENAALASQLRPGQA